MFRSDKEIMHSSRTHLICLVLLAAACSRREPYTPPPDTDDAADTDGVDDTDDEGLPQAGDCQPSDTLQPEAFIDYVAMCEPELGAVPVVDCGESVEIPIRVGGEQVYENQDLFACDAPSLQMGHCIPGSSLQRYEGKDPDGTPRPEVVWVSLCRSDGQEVAKGDGIHDSVQLIGYNAQTGATCFFESGDNEGFISIGDNNRLVGAMPGPGEPGFDTAYTTPGRTICVECHQSDPFIHNPWIDSALLPGSDEPVVPIVAGFDAPFHVVGGSDWDMRTIYIEGNACLGCHRVGMETELLFARNGLPATAHMPPHDPGSLAGDYQELLDCWTAGPEQTPGCEWIVPPGGECSGGIVGDDYPFKSDVFNDGGSDVGGDDVCEGGDWFAVQLVAQDLDCTYRCVAKGYDPVPNSSEDCPGWQDALESCSEGDDLQIGSTGDDGELIVEERYTCEGGSWPR